MMMKIKKNSVFLYMGAFFLIIKTMLGSSKLFPYTDAVDTIISALGACLLGINILIKRYKIKTTLVYLLLIGLTLYNSLVTGNNALMITVITCLAAKDCDMENFIKFIFDMEAFFFVIHTLCSYIAYCLGWISISQNIGGVLRYDWGMKHPNMFAAIAFNILIMWIWLNWRKIKGHHLFTMVVIAFVIYAFCKTRTSLLVMLSIISILLFRGLGRKFDKWIGRIAAVIIPVLAMAMVVFIFLYLRGNLIAVQLNRLLNARISLAAYAFVKYGFSFFGQDMSLLYTNTVWDPIWQLSAFTFDCLYSYMLINQGIIWLIVLTFLFSKLAKRKNVRDNVAIIAWALYGVTEVQGLNCFSCMPIILLSCLLGKEERLNE